MIYSCNTKSSYLKLLIPYIRSSGVANLPSKTYDTRRQQFNDVLMFYTVKDADTLPKIAENFYGDRSLWRIIYDANPDVIFIVPGVTLYIPLPKSISEKKVENNQNLYKTKGK